MCLVPVSLRIEPPHALAQRDDAHRRARGGRASETRAYPPRGGAPRARRRTTRARTRRPREQRCCSARGLMIQLAVGVLEAHKLSQANARNNVVLLRSTILSPSALRLPRSHLRDPRSRSRDHPQCTQSPAQDSPRAPVPQISVADMDAVLPGAPLLKPQSLHRQRHQSHSAFGPPGTLRGCAINKQPVNARPRHRLSIPLDLSP